MPNQTPLVKHRRPVFLIIATIFSLMLASAPMSAPAVAEWQHNMQINALEYKQTYGHWQTIDLPAEFRLNSIHAASLPTGKILLVAGSGNNREAFNTFANTSEIRVLKTVIYDPETNDVKLIDTPSDLFCAGHALLQSGNLLIAGGTVGYELLEGEVRKPGGAMLIHNEAPDDETRVFPVGTRFIGPSGNVYVSTQEAVVEPAHKMDHGGGNVMIHHSTTKIFVEAEHESDEYVTEEFEHFDIEGLKGIDAENIYGQGGPMTLDKQDFRGDNKAYEFDPVKEEYVQVGTMNESRWYPSLPVLTNGDVLAVSGLDNIGIITETTEFYDPAKKLWEWGPNRAFPTYPALFRTQDPDVLFYSGSSAGYGPEDKGRLPGFWNVKSNTFKPVEGLRQPDILETSASVVLPPRKGSNDGSQSWKIWLAGGGGVGESKLVTDRTDIIDLADELPKYQPGPNLPDTLRYLNVTVTPWDEIFGTGGNRDYRAKNDSYSYDSFSYNPTSGEMRRMADAQVGRGYHSGSLLLRDGRILVFGGDPLYGDKDNLTAGTFEQRLEIYTPPQFFKSQRPQLHGEDDQRVKRGQKLQFHSENADSIVSARLIPPSSATHVTNIEQRSVGAIVKTAGNRVNIELPKDENILPKGWYMLFVTNAQDMPSRALMIHVVN